MTGDGYGSGDRSLVGEPQTMRLTFSRLCQHLLDAKWFSGKSLAAYLQVVKCWVVSRQSLPAPVRCSARRVAPPTAPPTVQRLGRPPRKVQRLGRKTRGRRRSCYALVARRWWRVHPHPHQPARQPSQRRHPRHPPHPPPSAGRSWKGESEGEGEGPSQKEVRAAAVPQAAVGAPPAAQAPSQHRGRPPPARPLWLHDHR